MEEIEYGEFLRLDGGIIVRYEDKQDIRVENNRYIDYSGEYEWETRIIKHSSNIIDLIEERRLCGRTVSRRKMV